jgi:hypothetical protein
MCLDIGASTFFVGWLTQLRILRTGRPAFDSLYHCVISGYGNRPASNSNLKRNIYIYIYIYIYVCVLRISENRVMRISGPKREYMAGG